MATRQGIALWAAALCILSRGHLLADPPIEKTTGGHRQVSMKVMSDDQVLFEAGASDDGTPDPDAVWEYLKDARFRAGRDFSANEGRIRRDKGGMTVTGQITVRVAYGGEKLVDELTLKEIETEDGARWVIPETLVDKWFSSRLLSRRLAATLRNPRIDP